MKSSAPSVAAFGHVTSARFRTLDPVLAEWERLMTDTEGWGDDAPWWYNERASVSHFAGAIWRQRTPAGWAIEEYAVRRGSPNGDGTTAGRCDLAIELGELRLVLEAKQAWVRLDRCESAADVLATKMAEAHAAVARAPTGEGRYRPAGLVFVAPWYPQQFASDRTAVATWIQEMLTCVQKRHRRAAIAWAFPESRRDLRSARFPGRRYPGVILVLEGDNAR